MLLNEGPGDGEMILDYPDIITRVLKSQRSRCEDGSRVRERL